MSLSWDVSRIRDRKELMQHDSALAPITEALVFASSKIGLGHISETTLLEWRFRTKFYTRLFGIVFLHRGDLPGAFSEDELRRHIGLRTNVATISRPEFERICLAKVDMEVVRALVFEDAAQRPPCAKGVLHAETH